MLINPYIYKKDVYIKELNYATIDNSKIRLDSIIIGENYDKKSIFKRTSHFGSLINHFGGIINSFISSSIDMGSGELVDLQSSICNNPTSIDIPANYVGSRMDDVVKSSIYRQPIINMDKISNFNLNNGRLSTNYDIDVVMDCYEDEFNLDFNKTVGILIPILTKMSYMVPFRCVIIIDNELGINITNSEYVFNDSGLKDIVNNNYKEFLQDLNTVQKYFRGYCSKESRKMRLYIYLYEFGCILKVCDTEYDEMSYELNISLTDHCRFLRGIDAHEGPNYTSSEVFGVLLDTELPTLLPTLFNNSNEQREFIYGDNKNHLTEYNR
jgi:hypothetical protein